MPKSRRALLDLLPVGAAKVDKDGVKPYLLFPLLALWFNGLERKLSEDQNLRPDHAANVCTHCQALFARYTKKKQAGMNLKHSKLCCPLGDGTDRGMVDFTRFKTHLEARVRDCDHQMDGVIADALAYCKEA